MASPRKNFREYGILIYERTANDNSGKLLQSESYIRGIEYQAIVTNGGLHRLCGLQWLDFSENQFQQILPQIRQYFSHPCNTGAKCQELCSDGQIRPVYYQLFHEWEEGFLPEKPMD